MPRYDLVERDSSIFEFSLVDYSVRKERRKKRWGWLIALISIIAILAAVGLRNPTLLQQYTNIPTLIETVRFTASTTSTASTVSTLQSEGATETTAVENQDADPSESMVATEESVDFNEETSAAEVMEMNTPETEAVETVTVDSAAVVVDATVLSESMESDTLVTGQLKSPTALPIDLPIDNVSSDNPVGYSGTLLQTNSGSLSVVGADGSSVLDAPGGNLLTILTPGTIVNASGRTENNQWLMVSVDDGSAGWVSAGSLVVFGFENLPITSTSMAEGAVAEGIVVDSVDAVAQVAATTQLSTIQPTLIPSTTPSPTPVPTFTPTPEPTAAPIPTASSGADSLNTVFAVVRSRGTSLLSAPDGETIQSLRSGFTLNATGRSADSAWLRVTTPDGEAGWVGVDRVVAFRISSLPIIGDNGQVAASTGGNSTGGNRTGGNSIGGNSTGGDLLGGTTPEQSGVTGGSANNQASSTGNNSVSTAPAVARPTPINSDGLPVASIVAAGARLNIRSGPDSTYEIIGKALSDELFIALGRSEDSAWVKIEVPDLPGEFGWVSADFILLNESIFGLPLSNQVNFSADVYRESLNSRSATPVAAAASQAIANQAIANQAIANQAIASQAIASQAIVGENGLLQATPISVAAQPVAAAATINRASATSLAGLSGKLVFQESLGGNIYLYDFASSTLRTLSVGMDPAISADGTKVAFSRFGGDGGIYTVDVNGANEQRVYVDTTARSPKWSPDGEWIVFSRLTGEYSCRNIGFGICLENNPLLSQVTLNTKEERGLTRIDPQGDDFRDLAALNTAYTPDWNENGIVYQAVTSIEITEDKPDAETSAVLKQTIGFQDPDWQPNGGRIIFQGQQSSHWEIFSVQSDGGGLQALTKPVTALVDALPSNVSPAWSPDGQYIAYVSNRDADEEAGAWRLWVMNADGSNKRMLPIDVALEYAFNKEQMVSWGL